MFITFTVPVYLLKALRQNNELKEKLFSAIFAYIGVTYVAVVLFIFALLIFYAMSGKISDSIKQKYINENPYCQILKDEESNPKYFTFIENTTVPYKLILAESRIIYSQPNQESVPWKYFAEKELQNIESLCANNKSNNYKKNK